MIGNGDKVVLNELANYLVTVLAHVPTSSHVRVCISARGNHTRVFARMRSAGMNFPANTMVYWMGALAGETHTMVKVSRFC